MTWDAATPQGSEAVSLGDDRIRELKSDLEDALTVEHSFPIDTSAPGLIYTPSRGNTASRPTGTYLVTGRLYINTQTGCIERYNGASWDEVNTQPIDASITADHLAASVAGDGLTGGAGTPLAVNVGAGLEISADAIRIAAAAAGSGLSGGAGSALAVNVDNSTIEINSDTLRVKADGINGSHIADDSIDSEHIVDGSIDVAHLSAGVLALMSVASIQRSSGDLSFTNENGQKTGNVTISSVDTSKSYVILNGIATSADEASGIVLVGHAQLTSATNVAISVTALGGNFTGGVTVTVHFTVVEWP